MGKNVVLVLIICIIAGVVIYSLSVQQPQQPQVVTTEGFPAQVTETIEKVETQAKSLAQEAQKAVEEVKTQVEEQMQPPVEPPAAVEAPAVAEVPAAEVPAAEVPAPAADIQSQIKDLLIQAQAALDEGRFQDAINVANNILSNFDSNSLDAKNIIEIATQKMQEAAQQKAGDLMESLPSMGQ